MHQMPNLTIVVFCVVVVVSGPVKVRKLVLTLRNNESSVFGFAGIFGTQRWRARSFWTCLGK